ncbi:E3 ubiquitin-protein ligase rnf213-alpha-like isoform X2 [Littorina saxatilis]|uniref:E3 ubiquitin-protein ligase rnf213-alpha-like isoform X2 n=1 Tax=Littorina saxatilis TaxID=31220 RepID=UPI0038B6612C
MSLLTNKVEEMCNQPDGQLEILIWKPMTVFIQCLPIAQNQSCLSPVMRSCVESQFSFLQSLMGECVHGHICIKNLLWLLKPNHTERFCEVVSHVAYDNGRVRCALQFREKELTEFQRQAAEVCCALRHCQELIHTDDAVQTYEEFRERSGNIQDQRIEFICRKPSTPDHMPLEKYMPEIHVEAVPEAFRCFLPYLTERLSSPVFLHMLETSVASKQVSQDDRFWEVLVFAWSKAEAQWQNACDAMMTGKVTVEEAEKLFSVYKKDEHWFEKCAQELQRMSAEHDGWWVEERIEQFQCLCKLSAQRDAAAILCQVKEEFGFTGDVENIRTFQIVDMMQPIGKLDLSVVGTSKALEDIDHDSVEHFRQFGGEECSKFVTWVRETMAGDRMKEVKVFVDLALNYVGDDPKEMDKVRNLRAVITGYAPLIFQTGAASFLERCREVAGNIRADPELPAKLKSTVGLVTWFDRIHKFHGSVEKTAMAQVDSITATGILKMGRLHLQKEKKGKDLGLCDVICLEVPADPETETDGKTYSYQDLLDLQSRLMLVVGQEDEGRTSVDRFVSVMDSVERLVKTYIQLCHDGCLLFLNWTVKFFFDTRGVCCIVEFFQGEVTARQLKGKQESHTLEDYMAKVAHFLDSSLDSWLKYVADQRNTYGDLNMFTMDQLVFLQGQLAMLELGDVSCHVFPLLSSLLPGCSVDTLQAALVQAVSMDFEQTELEDEEESADNEEAKKAAAFIRHMQENSFSKQLAVRALQEGLDPTDFVEGVAWCINHEDDEEANDVDEKDNIDDRDENSSTSGTNTSMTTGTIASALQLLDTLSENMLSLDALATNLTDTWMLFLQRVRFSGEDFLSLQNLGVVLRLLAEQGFCKYNRKLPAPMTSGVPNLIVCPKCEVLKTVTSIYMFTKDALLPQPDEVLLCTTQTTSEEVGMFLRRAFAPSSVQRGQIHCLAFADTLDYDVSEKTEKELKDLINKSECHYQLVVVCTSENEFNARITASLERYNRPPPIAAADTGRMLDYLCSRFKVPDDIRPSQSAACIDPDRLCIRVVKSSRSGMGKTLYKKRLVTKLRALLGEDEDKPNDMEGEKLHVTVPLYEKHVDSKDVADTLLQYMPPSCHSHARLIHLDIAYEVQEGVDLLLYNLLVLGCITDGRGRMWRRSTSDLYLIEAMPLLEHTEAKEKRLLHQMFSILPSIRCCSPSESLSALEDLEGGAESRDNSLLFDAEEYFSEVFQRPFHYLSSLSVPGDPKPYKKSRKRKVDKGNQGKCLQTLLRHCGVKNPSWSELFHFVSFLNKQLEDFEHSIFCSSDLSQDLPGFPAFILRFLILMSRDFATRSIEMAEQSLPVLYHGTEDRTENHMQAGDGIEQFQMRRTWESSPHPCIFFNPDETTMTFLGFRVDPRSGNLLNQAGDVLQKAIMKRSLYHSLSDNGAPLSEDFDMLPRSDKLRRLYQVMGVPPSETSEGEGEDKHFVDPDTTYELTTDNAKKILAIYMRFRCNIPVIVMGETGCGKTRLVKFMCALQTPKDAAINTMVIMKVHGGTTAEDIHEKVREAEALAKETKESAEKTGREGSPRPIYTVLFFDEANTTEAIGAIKEVMCDGAMNGKPIKLHQNLKMVAACNPYRKHKQAVIQRLEKAGLGYHISAEKTCDKLGRVPMRQLVYRVQPLPQSMLPLVWDFGQLDTEVERLYITQMVLRYAREKLLEVDLSLGQYENICNILVEAQTFMRSLKDECSFVSLRDADRTLVVTSWFLRQQQLLQAIQEKLQQRVSGITMSLVLALAVCYRAGLPDKHKFDQKIAPVFFPEFRLSGPNQFRQLLNSCQEVLLQNVNLGEKIACNQALKENVFMMVVCIELRIPLFLVGKPGSSKSLAKTIVSDAMQGEKEAGGDLFKTLKEVQMVSFQCSPLATADGILTTFRQCANIQHGNDRDKFVAVAVLDEIGLAEDSPRMPLKALHPLLEEGCEVEEESQWEQSDLSEDEEEEEEDEEEEEGDWEADYIPSKQTRLEKVAFIGISNWALDPAKMNRGILVQRDVPDEVELVETARSICNSGEEGILEHVQTLVKKLAKAYLEVFKKATQRREFFGLRDFYSLVKMVHAIATRESRKLTKSEFKAAVRRNFGGFDDLEPLEIFEKHLTDEDTFEGDTADIMDSAYSALLRTALEGDGFSGEGRYLLLLTENYGGLHILTDNLLAKQSVVPIFGSSFPRDQEYTQVCRNINRIKVCMETGKTVVLLNLDNLYESLYDALNQYYSYLANARYVDLGLGTHRVKCKVDTKFRLIVVAEKQTVYEKFPIPLINRLEKHFLTVNNLLNEEQRRLQDQLERWVQHFTNSGTDGGGLRNSDVLIGYHLDTTASTVLRAWEEHVTPGQALTQDVENKILQDCQRALLWCATPDAVIRLQDKWCSDVYFQQQQHNSLAQYLEARFQTVNDGQCFMTQVTTHSKLLTDRERGELEHHLPGFSFTLLSLQAFHTEQQFRHQLSLFHGNKSGQQKVLMVQCERGNRNQDLLQCAQYCVQSTWSSSVARHHVVFIVQLPRVASTAFSGFMGGLWHCAHVDDLRTPPFVIPSMTQLQAVSPAQLLASALPCNKHEKADENEEQKNLVGGEKFCLSLDLARHLLGTCVQSAVAKIRDSEGEDARSTHRIELLLNWLENIADHTFLLGVLRIVSAVLREKETASADHKDPLGWLSRDAANPDWVKNAGTMRRAWMQCLERLIVPVLAGVVAYLDTNHNLDLMQEEGWVRNLWLSILSDPAVCCLRYSDLTTMSEHHTQLKEFACRCTFLPGNVAPALPFSWVLFEQLEAFLASSSDSEDGHTSEDAVAEALEESVFGQHLKDVITDEETAVQFVQCFLADRLNVCFRLNPLQHQMLMQCMQGALDQEVVRVELYRLIHVLVRVHHVLLAARPRLQAVLDMAACHPHAIQALQERRHDPQTLGPDPEPELVEDILLLEILTQELTPQKTQLNTDEGCRQWLDLYNTVAPVISRVLEDAHRHSTVTCMWLEEDVRRKTEKLWFSYGPWCGKHIQGIRCLWTRVSTVKLFIDYMSPLVRDTDSVRVDPINYNLLWTLLGDEADLKTKKTLDNVDKYLKRANGQMVKKLLGDVGSCAHCAIKLEGPPAQLPCGHRICDKCYTQDVRTSNQCPECHKDVPADFDPETSGCQDRAAVENLVRYQRQTSAFLMAVISQLCFSGQEPPEPEAVAHIFSYVIRHVEGVTTVQTQQLTLRDDQMDPSPVLRSFILRLLLKHSELEVADFINTFLSEARSVIEGHMAGQTEQSAPVLTELSLLIIYCIENLEYEADAVAAEQSEAQTLQGQCERVKEQLHKIRAKLEESALELSTLIALGQLRHALCCCADLVFRHVIEPADFHKVDVALKDLLMEAAVICVMGNNQWPKYFLVKQLCRDHGMASYTTLLQRAQTQKCLDWIKLEDVQQVEGVADRYLVCGPAYCSLRTEVMQEMKSQQGRLQIHLDEIDCSNVRKEYLVLLALCREVLMASVHSPEQTPPGARDWAQSFIQASRVFVDEGFAGRIVNNTLGVAQSALCVSGDQSLAQQSMMCLLTHFWLALRTQQQQYDLLAPLLALIQRPEDMRMSYLPTMPQDDVDQIIRALGIDHSKTMDDYNARNETPKLWQCPRGHRYAIGNCGNPNGVGRCPECGVIIGGKDYNQAAEGNQIALVRDSTQPGHTLGAVTHRSREAVPERGMSAAACTVLRFLTHAALYISASQPGQAGAVSQMVRPAIEGGHVIVFLWGHLRKDLQVLQSALGRSCDDVYLLLHHLCHQLVELPTVHCWHPLLQSKEEREKWEKSFTENYVQPVLQHMDRIIDEGNDLLLSDTRQGENQLLNVVFEQEQNFEADTEDASLQQTAAPWQYRTHITVDHFFRQFQLQVQNDQNNTDFPVLSMFHDESHHLRALHFVPEILRIQRCLLQLLRHGLSRADAAKTTVREMHTKKQWSELQELVAVFSKAWDIVKQFLISYRCMTAEGTLMQLPEEYHMVSVSENSPVGMLLPDTEGPGRCAYLLTHYLLVQHNHFMQRYSAHTRHTFEQLPEVPVHMITGRHHLVGYSSEADLLPLVLAHCNYSLHLGHGNSGTATRLDYDFQGFEMQLRNTLLLSKSRVHRNDDGSIDMETMVYCADTTNARLVNRLRDKIDQIPLSVRVQRQIASEFRDSLPDICQSIDSLNTTLNFLLTLKVTADQSLHSVMVDALKMKETEILNSQKAQQHCRVKHVQSLWLLLCFLRARILATHNEEAFDGQGAELRKELREDEREELNTALHRLSMERVEMLLTQVYMCIVLQLLGHSHDEDFARPDAYDLKWLVANSLENPLYSSLPEEHQLEQLTQDDLHNFPQSITASQAISTWIQLVAYVDRRQRHGV